MEYGPPEKLILPEGFPDPPAFPLATLLSPWTWFQHKPYLFDSFGLGLMLLQMGCPALRMRQALSLKGVFQQRLKSADYNLREAGASVLGDMSLLRDPWKLGLDGFDLACRLVCPKDSRISVQRALSHPFLAL